MCRAQIGEGFGLEVRLTDSAGQRERAGGVAVQLGDIDDVAARERQRGECVLDAVRLVGDERAGAGEPAVGHGRAVVHEVMQSAQEDRGDRGSRRAPRPEGLHAVDEGRDGLVGLVEHRPTDADDQLPLGDVGPGVVLGEREGRREIASRERVVEVGPCGPPDVGGHA